MGDRLVGTITDDKGVVYTVPIEGHQDADQEAWLSADLANQVRYNHASKAWHRWDEITRSWRPDKTRSTEQRAMSMARDRAALLARTAGKEAEQGLKFIRRMFDLNRVNSALDTLSTNPGYSTDGSDWDAEPYLLGCANGVLDLRTGKLLTDLSPSESRVTKSTGVVYDPAARTEHFIPFVRQISSGDDNLAAFYVQWFGYCLFGRNWEQKFLILTGLGRNGKGALTHAVRHAVGEYDAKASQGIYMKSRFGSSRSSEARSDLIELRGRRLAVMSEPEGGQFNEELLKAHTGGDPIVARPLYKPEVMWEPTHTITFLTNKPPSVEDIGPAMAERILVADFRERYEGAAADTKLYEKLEAEAPGILRLLVGAAVDYWREREAGRGLWYPERVVKASKAYLDANDPLGQALEDVFAVQPAARTQSRDLYTRYVEWHRESDDPSEMLSQTAFSVLLQKRGFVKRRGENGMVFHGLRPKTAMELAGAA